MKMLHGSCSNKWLLRIIENISQRILNVEGMDKRHESVEIMLKVTIEETVQNEKEKKTYHSKLVIGDINSHGLLSHSRLVSVTWGLIAPSHQEQICIIKYKQVPCQRQISSNKKLTDLPGYGQEKE